MSEDAPDPVPLPMDGVLDLHTFAPQECAAVVRAYLDAAREKGLREVRVIHGKGRGTLRECVHRELRRHPGVRGFVLADSSGGGWGATLVRLQAPEFNPTARDVTRRSPEH